MIKIEISGGSAEEISTHISELANLMSGVSVPAIAAATSEPAPEAPKPARRSRKSEATIEKAPEPEAKAEQPSSEPEAEPAPAETAVEDEPATEDATVEEVPVDDAPASENLALFQGFDTAGARTWIIENYLNQCFSDQAERTARFREIVSKFGYNSLTAVPAEKLVDVLLFTEEKIKEHAK